MTGVLDVSQHGLRQLLRITIATATTKAAATYQTHLGRSSSGEGSDSEVLVVEERAAFFPHRWPQVSINLGSSSHGVNVIEPDSIDSIRIFLVEYWADWSPAI